MAQANAKQKIASSNDCADSPELPALTPKQQAFVNSLLEGTNASHAYRLSYDTSRMAERTVWSEASRLRANPKVAAWLTHSQRIGADAAQVTMEAHLAALARARDLAIAHGQIAAGVQAEHYRGKAAGLYQEKLLLTREPSDTELIKSVEALFGKETAEALSGALGFEGWNEAEPE